MILVSTEAGPKVFPLRPGELSNSRVPGWTPKPSAWGAAGAARPIRGNETAVARGSPAAHALADGLDGRAVAAGRVAEEHPRRHLRAWIHDRPGGHERAGADPGAVKDHSVGANHSAVADGTTVQDGAVADHAAAADDNTAM